MTKLFYLLFFGIFITGVSIAQNQNNVWYFGYNAGVTFSTTPPSSITNGALYTMEGCATISDINGNLLFYTDGQTVYNSSHSIMTNGTGLFGDVSSTQSAIILPVPGSATLYYIFTLDAFAGSNGICYSIVDMSLSAGLGEVTIKNQQILATGSEKVAVAKHSNGIDYWVIFHGWGNDTFYAYTLSSTGLSSSSVNTQIGSVHSGGGGTNNANNAIGYMKVNHSSDMIAVAIAIQGKYELFQFDNSTGVLSNLVTISNPDNNSSSYSYGVEFSPNNQYLYVSELYSHAIYQYDLSTYNQTSVVNSKAVAGTVTGASIYYTGALQMGPDNKIYIAEYNTDYLGVVNNPDNPAATCNLVDNAILLSGNTTQLGLPSLVDINFFNNPNSIQYYGCYLDAYHFYLEDSVGINSVLWNFDDPASGVNNTSTLYSPVHAFSMPGIYNVSAIVSYPSSQIDTLFQVVTIIEPPELFLQDTVFACSGSVFVLSPDSVWSSYLWSTGGSSSVESVSQTGLYSLSVTDSAGCDITDEVFVFFTDTIFVEIDTLFCEGTQINFEGQVIDFEGEYWFSFVSTLGCDSIVVLNAVYIERPTVLLPEDFTICYGETFTLAPIVTGTYITYEWSDYYSGFSRDISDGGQYVFEVTYDCGIVQDCVYVTIDSCLSGIWFPNVFTPNGDIHNPEFKPEGTNIFDFHMMIFNRWGQLLYETTDFEAGWDGTFKGRECPEGVYFWIASYNLYRNSGIITDSAKGSVTLFR